MYNSNQWSLQNLGTSLTEEKCEISRVTLLSSMWSGYSISRAGLQLSDTSLLLLLNYHSLIGWVIFHINRSRILSCNYVDRNTCKHAFYKIALYCWWIRVDLHTLTDLHWCSTTSQYLYLCKCYLVVAVIMEVYKQWFDTHHSFTSTLIQIL